MEGREAAWAICGSTPLAAPSARTRRPATPPIGRLAAVESRSAHVGESTNHLGGRTNHEENASAHLGESTKHRGGTSAHVGGSPNHLDGTTAHEGGRTNPVGESSADLGKTPNCQGGSSADVARAPGYRPRLLRSPDSAVLETPTNASKGLILGQDPARLEICFALSGKLEEQRSVPQGSLPLATPRHRIGLDGAHGTNSRLASGLPKTCGTFVGRVAWEESIKAS